MPLLAFWHSNPAAITQLNIEQIVATAGDGKLRDDSQCSQELRDYLSQVSGEKLAEYAEYCLTTSFNKSGLILQDIVNELGRRLDYKVENGKYQGVVGGIGYDGIWRSAEGNELIIEVKTTDAYRISLDTIARYRTKLHDTNKVGPNASILLIVGREETGELEAQVRGSRHAWDMRLISVDALVTLVQLKESTEAGVTGTKIRSILVPMEFTRLDALVDVMFTAARDVETTADTQKVIPLDSSDNSTSEINELQASDQKHLQEKREAILQALNKQSGKKLVKRSQALYWDVAHEFRVACTISKRYTKRGAPPYWYAYHPTWDTFLSEGKIGLLVLGCMDMEVAFVIPLAVIRSHLDEFNTTTRDRGNMYWHLKIFELKPNTYSLHLPTSGKQLPLNEFMLPLP